MTTPVVSIDYAVVDQMSTTFRESADALNAVANKIGGASSLLDATGFSGLIGLAAQAMLLALEANAKAIGAHCAELAANLTTARTALADGDALSASRFSISVDGYQ